MVERRKHIRRRADLAELDEVWKQDIERELSGVKINVAKIEVQMQAVDEIRKIVGKIDDKQNARTPIWPALSFGAVALVIIGTVGMAFISPLSSRVEAQESEINDLYYKLGTVTVTHGDE